ncbi:MAG: IS3 family transposase [Chthoniobacterales bacterium]
MPPTARRAFIVELAKHGIRVGIKRVARLMRAAGLRGVSRRNWIVTTVRDRQARPAQPTTGEPRKRFSRKHPNRNWRTRKWISTQS